ISRFEADRQWSEGVSPARNDSHLITMDSRIVTDGKARLQPCQSAGISNRASAREVRFLLRRWRARLCRSRASGWGDRFRRPWNLLLRRRLLRFVVVHNNLLRRRWWRSLQCLDLIPQLAQFRFFRRAEVFQSLAQRSPIPFNRVEIIRKRLEFVFRSECPGRFGDTAQHI